MLLRIRFRRLKLFQGANLLAAGREERRRVLTALPVIVIVFPLPAPQLEDHPLHWLIYTLYPMPVIKVFCPPAPQLEDYRLVNLKIWKQCFLEKGQIDSKDFVSVQLSLYWNVKIGRGYVVLDYSLIVKRFTTNFLKCFMSYHLLKTFHVMKRSDCFIHGWSCTICTFV